MGIPHWRIIGDEPPFISWISEEKITKNDISKFCVLSQNKFHKVFWEITKIQTKNADNENEVPKPINFFINNILPYSLFYQSNTYCRIWNSIYSLNRLTKINKIHN